MIATRVVFFKAYLASADTSARIAVVKLHLKDTEARLQKAKQDRDTLKMMQATQEMRTAYQIAGIKMWKGLGPLMNIPFGYGMFRLTRNMCELPVPGMETGGILWFYDLTIADPYFILPVVTGAGTYFMFKVGQQQRMAVQLVANLVVPSLEVRQAPVAFQDPYSKSCKMYSPSSR